MKKILVVPILLVILILSACGKEKTTTPDPNRKVLSEWSDIEPLLKNVTLLDEATHLAILEMEDGGIILIELYRGYVPITVDNFASLANSGFYDGLTFHRVIKDFMIQGGDPNGDGSGGSSNNIPGEFLDNNVYNPISHIRGTISMARLGSNNNSASSQFFIVQKDSPHLNGYYAAFGSVVYGMDVVDRIASVATNAQDRPLKEVKIHGIRVLPIEKKLTPTHYAMITMMSGEVIELALYADMAPKTVAQFTTRANSGYFDGNSFNSIYKDAFIIVNEDPDIETAFLCECGYNGYSNSLSHKTGIISMLSVNADYGLYYSIDTQFMILNQETISFDGRFTAFGEVIKGMEIVERIANVQTNNDYVPLSPEIIQTIRVITNNN